MSREKRVVVTGAAGFLGSRVIGRLLALGYTVRGVDNLAFGLRSRVEGFRNSNFEFVEADIRDREEMKRAVDGMGQILHFAEVKMPRFEGAWETLEVNVEGTDCLLSVASEEKCRFLLGSTDEVYGKNTEAPLTEEAALILGQPTCSRWSLAVSKIMAEQLCFAHAEQAGFPAVILRYFGCYGPGQSLNWRGGPLSVFISAALNEKPIPVHGDGLQVRTFGHVDDMVEGTVAALESPYSDGEIINVAGPDTIKIVNLAYYVWRLVGNAGKPSLEFQPYSDFSENYEDARCRVADVSKAQYLLGYSPQIQFEAGLKETIEWQRAADSEGT